MNNGIVLIQGVFFQPEECRFSNGLFLENLGSADACLPGKSSTHLFSGSFDLELGTGVLCDEFGIAELGNVEKDEKHLEFYKKYLIRPEVIQYRYVRDEIGIWRGQYCGLEVGRGATNCVLTNVPREFLLGPETSTRECAK